jgi:hypothetical protein
MTSVPSTRPGTARLRSVRGDDGEPVRTSGFVVRSDDARSSHWLRGAVMWVRDVLISADSLVMEDLELRPAWASERR